MSFSDRFSVRAFSLCSHHHKVRDCAHAYPGLTCALWISALSVPSTRRAASSRLRIVRTGLAVVSSRDCALSSLDALVCCVTDEDLRSSCSEAHTEHCTMIYWYFQVLHRPLTLQSTGRQHALMSSFRHIQQPDLRLQHLPVHVPDPSTGTSIQPIAQLMRQYVDQPSSGKSLKARDDVLGGEKEWANAPQAKATCPRCSNEDAYYKEIQARDVATFPRLTVADAFSR